MLYLPQTDNPDEDNTSALINPCGLVAWSYFNDTLDFLGTDGLPFAGISESEISWSTDRNHKFKNNPDGTTGQFFAPFAHERAQSCAALPTTAQQTACASYNIPEAGWCYPGSGFCNEAEHFIVWMVRL